MKKLTAFSLVLMLCAGVMAGCGKDKTPDESTLYVHKNGKVTAVEVEAFDENTYDFAELQQYVEDTIAEYDASHDKHSVKLKSLKMQGENAVLTIEYKTAEDYEEFNDIKLFSGSVAEALAAGYSFSQDFVKVDGDTVTPVDSSEIVNLDGYRIVIVRSNTNVKVKGTVQYTSVRNVDSVGKDTVVIRPGVNLLETAGISADTSADAGTESVATEDTQAQETTGAESVGDDDLLNAEDTQMIEFDFGSDTGVTDTDYTNVYTYIIYK